MAVASEYGEFLAAGERRRAALRSTPLHVAIVVGYGAICGVGAWEINTGLLLLITLAGTAALRAILKSLPVLGVVAILVAVSVVFPVLAILPLGYGLYLLFRRIRFFLENFKVIVLGLVMYGGALLLQVYGADLARSMHLASWVGAPIAGLIGAVGAELLLRRAYAMGYTTRRAFEIMSIVPLLLLSLLLPLIKVAFEIHPAALDAHAGAGEAFAAGDVMASRAAFAGEFGAAGAIAHGHAAHVGMHHDPTHADVFGHGHPHALTPATEHFGEWQGTSTPSHHVAGIEPHPQPLASPSPSSWHPDPLATPGHPAVGFPHQDAGALASHVAAPPVHAQMPGGQHGFSFHHQMDGTDHVAWPHGQSAGSIQATGNGYLFRSSVDGHVNHQLHEIGGRHLSQDALGQVHGQIVPDHVTGSMSYTNDLGQVTYVARPFGGQIQISNAMTGQTVTTVGAAGWNAARFDFIVRNLR